MAAATRQSSLRRQTVTEAVTEALRERILSGAIADGEQLRQDGIAAQFDVSRIPVREALRQLEAEGLVVFHAHRGAVVTTLSLDEIAELFEVRAQLETGVLRRAVPRLTPDDLAAAEAHLDRFDAAFAAEDVAVWGELNWLFHATLYEAADRPRTLAIIRNLHNNTDRYIRLQLRLTGSIDRAQREHRELLTLCRQGNADAACALLAQHILDASQALVVFLEKQRDGKEIA